VLSAVASSWDELLPLAPLITPVAVLVAAVVGLTGVVVTLRQKRSNDDRDAWWKRAQWAIDKSLSSDDGEAQVGLGAMVILATTDTPTKDDLRLLRVAIDWALDAEGLERHSGDSEATSTLEPAATDGPAPPPDERR
jgi:hypothetical protein